MSTRTRRSTASVAADAPPVPARQPELFTCTWEGCTHRPFQTKRGLQGHIKSVHEAAAATGEQKTEAAANPIDPSLEEESEEPMVSAATASTPKAEKKKAEPKTVPSKVATPKAAVPKVATPAPKVATPAPKVATPAPKAATPAPKAATPAPKAATPAPKAVTPAPAPTPKSATPKTAEKKKTESQTVAATPKSVLKGAAKATPKATPKVTVKATPEPSEPSSSDVAEPSTRVMRKRPSEKPATPAPAPAETTLENSAAKKKKTRFSDSPLREAVQKLKIEKVEDDCGIMEEIDEHHVPVTVFVKRPEPPQTIFSVGEMAKKLLVKLNAKQGLTKRKLKKEFCVACLDYKLTGGNCSNEHDDNDDRIQKLYHEIFPDRNHIGLTKQIVHDDLTKIAKDWF